MQTKQEILTEIKENNLNISYTGSFDSQILSVIAKNVENKFSKDPLLNKKLFKIFIELAQNIALYSAERVSHSKDTIYSGYGSIFIKEFEDNYTVYTGNMANIDDINPAIERCKTINSLSRKKLREYKRERRRMPAGKKGGGNIGLIQISLMANNPIDYKVINIDENKYFYILAIKINKNTKLITNEN